MSENKNTDKSGGADWFVQGILAKIGDIFDKMTGRGWQKASSLSATELVERLKLLLDSEVRDLGDKGKFVPHNIKLKMQWNKFSTDSPEALKRLEYELLAAAIDHINDNLYHTYKPFKIEIKPDYFTDGVKFLSSFGADETEAEVAVSVPQMKAGDLVPEKPPAAEGEIFIADFTIDGKHRAIELKFNDGKKRISVGRTKENDLMLDDASISKIHAALVLNPQNVLLVADTGSTNGTFINGNRIAYGRAFPIGESDKVKFGNVEVFLRRVPKPTDFATQESYQIEPGPTEGYQLEPAPTVASPAALPPPESIPVTALNVETSQQGTDSTAVQNRSARPGTNQYQSMQVPTIPDYGFDDQEGVIPAAAEHQKTPQNPQDEAPLNPTEPRIKLNFDE